MQNYAGFEGCVKEPYFNAVKVVSTLQQVLHLQKKWPALAPTAGIYRSRAHAERV